MPQPFQKPRFKQLLRKAESAGSSQTRGQPKDGAKVRTQLMAILNITPDSFSDGGTSLSPSAALAKARLCLDEGADLLDMGAESTKPGSQPVSSNVQLDRLLPVLRELVQTGFPLPITIDTTSAEVADACLAAGADAINDISGGLMDPAILPATARHGAGYIAMHMQGTPATMQLNPTYSDVVAEVIEHLNSRLAAARSAGIDPDALVADPGIGFGKTLGHNLELLRATQRVRLETGVPILIGTSRKGFLGAITGRTSAQERLAATAASVAYAATNGAAIVRVHDVPEMKDVLAVINALQA